jgi:hypothetical protein
VARLELAGPQRRRAGIDVRGDGSLVAYTGWIRRRTIEPQAGEGAVEVLQRELED